MASPLPPLKRDELSKDQQEAYDKLTTISETAFETPDKSPFIWKGDDGALVGPYPFFLAFPAAGTSFMGHYSSLAKIPGLPADAKEVVILTVGAKYQAAYELYAHINVATKKVGMDKKTADSIARGEKPDGLDEKCSAAYDAAHFLANAPDALPRELWDKCEGAFGKDGTIALVHYVGAYAYTCITLNAMNAPVPEE